MAIAGQRSAQQPQRAGMQSSRALGRSARARGGMADELIVQLDKGWVRLYVDEDGLEQSEPYDMKIDREV